MDYTTMRPSIRSGDLLAWSHRTPWWKSWRDFKIAMVRLVGRSEYSHVGVAWVVGARVFVIEAVMPFVRNFPLSKTEDFYLLPMNAPWSEATEEFALSTIGDPYSQSQAMQAPFHLPSKDRLWECAELSRAILACDGIVLGNEATPWAVVQAALERGATCQFVRNTNE